MAKTISSRLSKIFVFILISIFATQTASSHDIIGEHSNVKIKLKWHHQFQFAGYYAALIKGYYKESGLNVEIVEGSAHSAPIQYVLKDSAEYGISASDLIESKASGKPIVLLAAIFQHSPYVIISQKDKNIIRPKDLIGKKLMSSTEQGYVQLKAMLQKNGIDISRVNIINHTWQSNDITNGYADAMSGYISIEPFQLNKNGVELNLIRPMNYGIDFYGDLLFTTEKEITDHPERAKAIRDATVKGWEYAMTHSEEISNYILTLPGVKERGITREHLMYESIAMQDLVMSDLVEIGNINRSRLENMINKYKEFGVINNNQDFKNFVFVETPEDKYNNLVNIIYYLIAIVAIILLIIFIWNRQLHLKIKKRTIELEKEVATRKEAELTAKRSEERLELALQAARLGIWDSNIQTGYVYRNAIWSEMLGYKANEIEPNYEGWRKLIHPEDYEKIDESIKSHHEGKTIYDNYEHRLITANGEWKWILSLSKIISRDDTGKPTRLIGIHIDIDELKRKEIQMRQISEELTYTNRELEKFAYITSHNLRAPVVNIVSLLNMVDKSSLVENGNLSIFDKIGLSVQRLEITLNDLIEVVSAKKIILSEKKSINISECTKLVLSNLETQLIKVDAEVIFNFDKADRILYINSVLESVIQNLITNAIKYRSPERRLKIEINTTEDKEYVYLKVKDNGIGFDSSKYGEKIFKLYERVHHNIEGKGLGLYLIKTQIEALNGKIDVNSIPNEGAIFIVSIKKENQYV
ncbi:MAG: ABC transporter substrate-binding protein [bacterium]|jgi:PAS domain S-box-containing protein